jgi:histidyl-tRNA synthetase
VVVLLQDIHQPKGWFFYGKKNTIENMKKGPVTPKGFRDLDPNLAKKRRIIIGKIADILETFSFKPLETPIVEFADTLLGKYGKEERLIYQFTDKGGRKLALRFDLTVPLARYITNNPGVLDPTFSRYQIGQVFRGENPQKGRYREFTQFDFDIVGSTNLSNDAQVITAAIQSARAVGLNNAKMLVNDRFLFKNIKTEYVRAIDKLSKIGKDGVISEMKKAGADDDQAKEIITSIEKSNPTADLISLFLILKKNDLEEGKDFEFDPTLARGLDYYTSIIFELKPSGKKDELSIGGGGRYDNLIGMFADRKIPAVGFSFGVDRLIEMVP